MTGYMWRRAEHKKTQHLNSGIIFIMGITHEIRIGFGDIASQVWLSQKETDTKASIAFVLKVYFTYTSSLAKTPLVILLACPTRNLGGSFTLRNRSEVAKFGWTPSCSFCSPFYRLSRRIRLPDTCSRPTERQQRETNAVGERWQTSVSQHAILQLSWF